MGPLILAGLLAVSATHGMEPSEVVVIWPGEPPGQGRAQGEEKVVQGRPRPFYQLTDISRPTLGVFLPPREARNGTALLVLPGGGLQRLAYEHEGLEVATWAVRQGISAFVLKYRVPGPAEVATADAQRALSLVRARAAEWKVDPESVGVIGFSAGAEIAAWMISEEGQRRYAAIDGVDGFSCQPDFLAMIYPGGLIGRAGSVKEPLGTGIRPGSPPMFFVHAANDASENSLLYALALKRARVPVELHLYRDGGHGFGVRPSGLPLGGWSARWMEWMDSLGFMDRPEVRDYVEQFSAAVHKEGQLPVLPDGLSMDDAMRAQRRLVRRLTRTDPIAGFKGAAITEEAQASLGLREPITGVLFQGGRLRAQDQPVIDLRSSPDVLVETEIGYIIGTDISFDVLSDAQARDAVQSVVPVIELPVSYARRLGRGSARDTVASNVGSARFIVGEPQAPARVPMEQLKLRLRHDGQVLHEAGVDTIPGGQWRNLRLLLNQITRAGHTIREGSLIISGAIGGPKPGLPGKYTADFAELGLIEFELR